MPPPLEDDPTGGAPRTVCPSPTGSDHRHYLTNPDLYQGPIDVTPADMPELFDIVLPDIDDKVLHNEISTEIGLTYLSETSHLTSPHATVNGIMFGQHHRVLFPLVVRLNSRSYIIYFLFDSGSPFTFLSREVCDKLFGTNPVPKRFTVQMNGQDIQIHSPNANSHFEHVNRLGTDFFGTMRIKVNLDYEKQTAMMYTPQWE